MKIKVSSAFKKAMTGDRQLCGLFERAVAKAVQNPSLLKKKHSNMSIFVLELDRIKRVIVTTIGGEFVPCLVCCSHGKYEGKLRRRNKNPVEKLDEDTIDTMDFDIPFNFNMIGALKGTSGGSEAIRKLEQTLSM